MTPSGNGQSTEDFISLHSPKAFKDLYTRSHLMVFRYIYALNGGPKQEVEDLTAETFTRAWKARRRFKGNQDAAVGWLLRIARNLVIDSKRRLKAKVKEQGFQEYIAPTLEPSPEDHTITREEIHTLWTLIGDLKPIHREMIVLRYITGWPVNRISAHLGIAENTVSVNIRRILKRLRRDWPDEL
jgi:RNA polymerase sigma-70 factor (ECF subfamily)